MPVRPDGRLSVEALTSRPGDHVVFRAEMDLVVGLTACAAAGTSNGHLKPIDYEFVRGPSWESVELIAVEAL